MRLSISSFSSSPFFAIFFWPASPLASGLPSPPPPCLVFCVCSPEAMVSPSIPTSVLRGQVAHQHRRGGAGIEQLLHVGAGSLEWLVHQDSLDGLFTDVERDRV